MKPQEKACSNGGSPHLWKLPRTITVAWLALLMALLIPIPIHAAGVSLETQPAASTPSPATSPTPPSASTQPSPVTLMENLTNGEADIETRIKAASQILQIGSGEEALVNILRRKNDDTAKLAICQAIAAETKAHNPVFIAPLEELLQHQDITLQKAAIAALSGYSDPQVAARLEAFKKRQERTLLADKLEQTMNLLYERSTEAQKVELLKENWLKSPVAIQREIALKVVHQAMRKGTQPDPGVLEQIRIMLGDPDESVRLKVVETLRTLRKREDAPPIRAMLEQPQSPALREAIYKALGLLEDPQSILCCIKGLKDPESSVAAEAATALGLLGKLNPAPPPDLLQSAAQALMALASEDTDDDNLREQVIGALANIANPGTKEEGFLAVLGKHAGADEPVPAIRQAAISGIGRIGDASQMGLLVERLTVDEDPRVREVAAEAIGMLGSKTEHLKPLRDKLDAHTEKSATVRTKAWEAYRQIFSRIAPTLEPNQQQELINSWKESDQATIERRIELLSDLKKHINTSHPDLGQLAWIMERLVDDYLQVSSADKAIAAAAEAKLTPQSRDAVAARFLKFAQDIAKTDPKSALDFLDKLEKSIPNKFSEEWSAKFNAVRESANKSLQLTTQPATTPAN